MDDAQWKRDVIAAEQLVTDLENTVVGQKELLKDAKDSYEKAVDRLRNVIHPNP